MTAQKIKSIICDSCSEPAVEYDVNETSASTMDGKDCVCMSCAAIGRVSIDADCNENGYYDCSRFYPFKEGSVEMSHLDYGTLVEGYEASQRKLEDMYFRLSAAQNKLRDIEHARTNRKGRNS